MRGELPDSVVVPVALGVVVKTTTPPCGEEGVVEGVAARKAEGVTVEVLEEVLLGEWVAEREVKEVAVKVVGGVVVGEGDLTLRGENVARSDGTARDEFVGKGLMV